MTNGTTTLTNCTVSGNSANTGGGVYNYGTTTLGNTIVVGNTASGGPDVDGFITSQGNNLVGVTDGSSGWVASDLTGTIAAPLDPVLARLGNFGGPTQTMALLPGSPAIDAGNNAHIPDGVTTDQPRAPPHRPQPCRHRAPSSRAAGPAGHLGNRGQTAGAFAPLVEGARRTVQPDGDLPVDGGAWSHHPAGEVVGVGDADGQPRRPCAPALATATSGGTGSDHRVAGSGAHEPPTTRLA